MKTRQSLVSNSSTTSFCIYGIVTEEGFRHDLKEIFTRVKKFQSEFPSMYNNYLKNRIDQCSKEGKKDLCSDQIKLYDFFLSISNKNFEDYKKFQNIQEDEDTDDDSLYEFFSELCGVLSLSVHTWYDANTTWIGRDFINIKDDETGKQFKDSVINVLTKIFDNIECTTYQEAWRDG